MATINPLQSAISGTILPTVDLTSKKPDSISPSLRTDEANFSRGATEKTDDAAKISELKKQIANGTYRPNASAIAAKLLQEAWLLK